MVIGQDFGSCDCNYFATDSTLNKIFSETFSVDISNKNSHLYFTNIANCYRNRKSVGSINKGCLALCANKFMSRLIDIISPKIIIVLGQETFNALACCDKSKLICKNPTESKTNNNFSTVISFNYILELEDGREISVFPVYHPGAKGKIFRPYELQLEDWKKIYEFAKKEQIFLNEKHLVYHHNMFGPSCEIESISDSNDFKIYCHKEHKICIPKNCDKCKFFGGSEMGTGICCIWEESLENTEHVVQHDEAYMEFQRIENPEMYKKMLQMIEKDEIDLCET